MTFIASLVTLERLQEKVDFLSFGKTLPAKNLHYVCFKYQIWMVAHYGHYHLEFFLLYVLHQMLDDFTLQWKNIQAISLLYVMHLSELRTFCIESTENLPCFVKTRRINKACVSKREPPKNYGLVIRTRFY